VFGVGGSGFGMTHQRAPLVQRLLTMVLAATVLTASASADSPKRLDDYWREVWTGADVSARSWLVYSGATVAPWSAIHSDGFRLRTVLGYGQYQYDGEIDHSSFDRGQQTFKANTAFVDVLAGYQVQWRQVTAKAFVGVSFIDHTIAPYDVENFSVGGEFGVKGVIEIWMNTGPRSWSSLDVSYTTAHETGAIRTRSGYRLTPHWSVGGEGGLNLDGQGQCKMRLKQQIDCRLNDNDTLPKSLTDFGRMGLFARYEWDGGEVSVSGGALGQVFNSESDIQFEPYATVNWIMKF
jgi:Cellulose biosynthesis protein BcsS